MVRVRNVLVFPAGTEIGLEIYAALRHCKEVRLFGAGQIVSNHGKFAYPEFYSLPSIYEPDWLEALISLCKSCAIDYIFPAYDDVIVSLSKELQRVPAKVLSSPADVCFLTRSKFETYRALAGHVRVPALYSVSEVTNYPVLVKPDRGQGSQGITKVNNSSELLHAISTISDPIICEYLPGEEYTVDCFSDRERGVLFAGARLRLRTRNGISVNSKTVYLPEAISLANIINKRLSLRGAWFFQLKRTANGELALLEIAPRIAGSMATHRVQGINFPLLSIFEEERLPIKIVPNKFDIEIDRALGNRYKHSIEFSTLYIDLDDTLLINNSVNLDALQLIFQCINNRKKVILITRHDGDLESTLARHRLAGVFDEVIHLRKGEKKSSYITNRESVYIDDSFSERMDVAENCGITTLDCSMIELLTMGRYG